MAAGIVAGRPALCARDRRALRRRSPRASRRRAPAVRLPHADRRPASPLRRPRRRLADTAVSPSDGGLAGRFHIGEPAPPCSCRCSAAADRPRRAPRQARLGQLHGDVVPAVPGRVPAHERVRGPLRGSGPRGARGRRARGRGDGQLRSSTRSARSFPIGLDRDGAAQDAWGALALPVHFWVDAEGIVRDGALGGIGPDIMADGARRRSCRASTSRRDARRAERRRGRTGRASLALLAAPTAAAGRQRLRRHARRRSTPTRWAPDRAAAPARAAARSPGSLPSVRTGSVSSSCPAAPRSTSPAGCASAASATWATTGSKRAARRRASPAERARGRLRPTRCSRTSRRHAALARGGRRRSRRARLAVRRAQGPDRRVPLPRRPPDPVAARAAVIEALDRGGGRARRRPAWSDVRGRRVVEVRPAGAGGKGAALERLLSRASGRAPCSSSATTSATPRRSGRAGRPRPRARSPGWRVGGPRRGARRRPTVSAAADIVLRHAARRRRGCWRALACALEREAAASPQRRRRAP